MENPDIDFKKERDFGSILSTTFAFIKQEFKPLFKAVIVYMGPFILLMAIINGYYQSSVMDISFFFKDFHLTDFFEKFFLFMTLLFCATLLCYTMIILTIYSYIKLYNEKGRGGFEFEDIGRLIAKNFFKVFGSNILFFLIVGMGMIFCILPGIYLGVSLSLIFSIMIIEDLSFGSAFSRSFSLTHFQWWWTLLLVLVVYMIIGVVGYIFTIPQVILSFIYGFNSLKSGAETPESIKEMMLIVTTFSTFILSILGVIPFIAFALQYFNIVEKKKILGNLNHDKIVT